MAKVVVGLSGGVDSTIALILLKQQGWEPVGVSLKYALWEDEANTLAEHTCCSAESFALARRICGQFKVPYRVLDVSGEFKQKVIAYFTGELSESRTPNPCVVCNPELKFKALLDWAKAEGIEYVATGHYARIQKDPQSGNYQMLRAKDRQKDQTYSLSFLPYQWLARLVLPLGEYLKTEVYELAKQFGLDFYLKQKQSQDFCFVGRKALKSFYQKVLGLKPGPIKDLNAKVLGEHPGLHFFTLGQRKGLGLKHGSYFVVRKSPADNTLWVSEQEADLFSLEVKLSPYNFLSPEPPGAEIQVKARLRYRQSLEEALLSPEGDHLKLTFSTPQRAATPGQFGVFYREEVCLGGGRIA